MKLNAAFCCGVALSLIQLQHLNHVYVKPWDLSKTSDDFSTIAVFFDPVEVYQQDELQNHSDLAGSYHPVLSAAVCAAAGELLVPS